MQVAPTGVSEVLAGFCDAVRLAPPHDATDVLRRYVALHLTRVDARDVFAHHIDSNASSYDTMEQRAANARGATPLVLYRSGKRTMDPATFVLAAQHTVHVPGAATLEAFLGKSFRGRYVLRAR